MIVMSLMSTYEEYRREQPASLPADAPPARPVRHTLMRILSLVGLGVGGMAAQADDDELGIG